MNYSSACASKTSRRSQSRLWDIKHNCVIVVLLIVHGSHLRWDRLLQSSQLCGSAVLSKLKANYFNQKGLIACKRLGMKFQWVQWPPAISGEQLMCHPRSHSNMGAYVSGLLAIRALSKMTCTLKLAFSIFPWIHGVHFCCKRWVSNSGDRWVPYTSACMLFLEVCLRSGSEGSGSSPPPPPPSPNTVTQLLLSRICTVCFLQTIGWSGKIISC